MRGLSEVLASPVAIADLLPAIYRDLDPNLVRMTEAFDTVLAPVFLVLDNLDAYLDPALAPPDFVALLAAWVGVQIDANWREQQLRHLVADAVDLHRWCGTARGVVALVEAYTGATPEVEESGATSWSPVPGAALPGCEPPAVRVRVRLPRGATEDLQRLTRMIAEHVPAHVATQVEIVRDEP